MEQKVFLRKFTCRGKQYLLDLCKWKSIINQSQDNQSFPSKRYSHCSCILDGFMYIFGGAKNTNEQQNTMYVLNLTTMNWTSVKNQNIPENRDSYGCATFQNSIYIFGGSVSLHEDKNDLIIFNPLEDRWSTISTLECPQPRELPLFISINDEFLFLYGGIDIKLEQIREDAYIFIHQQWHKVSVKKQPPKPRIGMGLAVCGKRVFMFGGEGADLNYLFFDDLYELLISEIDFSVTFKKINPNSVHNPSARAYHGMTGLSKDYFLIIGGQSQARSQSKDSSTLKDIWAFDIFQMQWLQIQPKNGPLKPFHSFSLSCQDNKIYMFGGMKNQNLILGDMICLSFAEEKVQKALIICSECRKEEDQNTIHMFHKPYQPKISLGFLYNVALEIKHPFQAIALILDAVQELNSTYLRIQTNSQIGVIQITFDGDFLKHLQYNAFVQHRYINEKVKKISNNLKLGGFKLGKTILLVNADSQTRKVFLISANSMISPNYQEELVFYTYTENITNGLLNGIEGQSQKQLIINSLYCFVDDPALYLQAKNINKIYILSANCIMILEKAYYYELINYTQYDIRTYRNPKMLEFMYNQLKIDIYNHPQLSLCSFLGFYQQNNKFKMYINALSQPLQITPYEQILSKYQKAANIINLSYNTQQIPNVKYKADIYLAMDTKYLPDNHGILIYYHGRLINRFQCQFGNLFRDKFYKSKFKIENLNLFKFLGLINIQQGLKTNIIMTDFVKTHEYLKLMTSVINFIEIKNKKNISSINLDCQDEIRLLDKKLKV